MKICGRCGEDAQRFRRLESYKSNLLGIPIVIVGSAFEVECTGCREPAILIPDQSGLVAAAALGRVHIPVKLNGHEVRFLRKALRLKGTALSEILEVAPETLSRWESERAVIGSRPERLLRIEVAISLAEQAPAVDIDIPALMRMHFSPVRNELDQNPMQFELVWLKADRQKRQTWDMATEAIAA